MFYCWNSSHFGNSMFNINNSKPINMKKIVQIIDKASKIGVLFMGVFLPLYILYHLIF